MICGFDITIEQVPAPDPADFGRLSDLTGGVVSELPTRRESVRRTFHAERDRTVILIADFRPSMLWGTRRTLRSVAAAEAEPP